MKLLLETLKAGTGYLEKRGIEDARLNMEHLLAHVLRCRRLELYMRFNEAMHETDLETLRGLIKRRGEGEPLQHLLGTVEFCGAELVCDHRALVPRPETERLVELLIEKFKTQPPAKVLDVGTGSGCIGLSLAKAWSKKKHLTPHLTSPRGGEGPVGQESSIPEEAVPLPPGERLGEGRISFDSLPAFTLIDISEDALELARLNASRIGLNGTSIRFLRSDLFEKVDGEFDLIVANLPYIPAGEIPALSPEVRRDPVLALDGGVVGTELIARFVTDCQTRLASGGWIALEIGHDQAPAVTGFCEAAGMTDVKAEQDLTGIDRFVLARRA
jgi:release factor glutamine methyltransferase